jgi:hypothetical protein
MDVFGNSVDSLTTGLSGEAVTGATTQVFGAFAGVIVGAILLTLTVYFIRKILNGANKGKARLR